MLDDEDNEDVKDDLQDDSLSSDNRTGNKSAGEPVVLPDSDDEDSVYDEDSVNDECSEYEDSKDSVDDEDSDYEDSTQGNLDQDQTGVSNPAQAGVTNPEEQDTAGPAGVEEQDTVDHDKPAGLELQDAVNGNLDVGGAELGGVIARIGRTVMPPKNYTANYRNKAYNLFSAGDQGLDALHRNRPTILPVRGTKDWVHAAAPP